MPVLIMGLITGPLLDLPLSAREMSVVGCSFVTAYLTDFGTFTLQLQTQSLNGHLCLVCSTITLRVQVSQ